VISTATLARLIRERDHREKTQAPEGKQAHAKRVLQVQYGAVFPDVQEPCYACPPREGYTWEREDTYYIYGTDSEGRDVRYDFRNGKITPWRRKTAQEGGRVKVNA
jgi:hypothetical protein